MSEPHHDEAFEPDHDEVVDAVPVLPGESLHASVSQAEVLRRGLARPLPAPIQTVAAAAGGFVAGAALLGLAHRRRGKRVALAGQRPPRRVGRPTKRSKAAGAAMDVVATRSFLVDVHLLRPPLGSR
ncbi:MAG TPA: hypothetical protein VK672_00300 [Solirubrobacteraceae bacterium]|nr:hypothetical protein [Solirubrobacteraceae bacterium]